MAEIKKYLIDSDILIDYLRGIKRIKNFLLKLREEGILLISVINVVEIYSGREIKDLKKEKLSMNF